MARRPLLRLTRAYLPDGSATLGRLDLPCGWQCFTLELPWQQNAPRVSCIPEGTYPLALRRSEVVQRTSGGEFRKGWEVQGVKGRTFIMVHPGNYAKDTLGCPLVGRGFSWHTTHGPMVTHSRQTFQGFMARMAELVEPRLEVRCGRLR